MKSTAELQAIRDKLEVEKGFSCAVGENDTKLVVCFDDEGVAAARNVIKTFMDEIEKRRLVNVKVILSGSTAKIDGEPIVEVTVPGKNPVKYTEVNPDKAFEIIANIK